MDDYRRCEAAMRQILAPHVVNRHEAHALASALMTHAQQFALAWARLYRELDERR